MQLAYIFFVFLGLCLVVFRDHLAREGYDQQRIFGFRGSLQEAKIVYLIGGSMMAFFAGILLLVELLM